MNQSEHSEELSWKKNRMSTELWKVGEGRESREEARRRGVSECAWAREPSCRMSQVPNKENFSKKEGVFICITYYRGAKREIVEAQLWVLAFEKPLASGSRAPKDTFSSMRAAPVKCLSLRQSANEMVANIVDFSQDPLL